MLIGKMEELAKLLAEYKDETSEVDAGDVLNCIVESVAAGDCWFVPVGLLEDGENETDIAEGSGLEKLPMFRKTVVTNKKEERFFCAFTSEEAMNADREEGTRISVKYSARACLRDLLSSEEIEGLVINPWTESFSFRKDTAETILDLADSIPEDVAAGYHTYRLSPKAVIDTNKILSDSTAATILAGGVLDGGVALYQYAKGEIDSEELVQQLTDTAVKSVSTVYFTKAVEAAVGAANPFLPIAIYTLASYVVTNTREIIKNAKLNEEEYNRMAGIYMESTALLRERHAQLLVDISTYRENQQRIMTGFLEAFDYNLETGENYEYALFAIVNFADQAGIALQHASFSDFKDAMNSDDVFVLS